MMRAHWRILSRHRWHAGVHSLWRVLHQSYFARWNGRLNRVSSWNPISPLPRLRFLHNRILLHLQHTIQALHRNGCDVRLNLDSLQRPFGYSGKVWLHKSSFCWLYRGPFQNGVQRLLNDCYRCVCPPETVVEYSSGCFRHYECLLVIHTCEENDWRLLASTWPPSPLPDRQPFWMDCRCFVARLFVRFGIIWNAWASGTLRVSASSTEIVRKSNTKIAPSPLMLVFLNVA